MNKIPFEYSSIAENEYFIDRIEDRRDLKTFLEGCINVMQISPRRWGKSISDDTIERICNPDRRES